MQWLWGPQKGIRFPGTGDTDSYKLLYECQELNQVPLEEQPVLKSIAISPAAPLYFRAIVSTYTMCGTPICKCLQKHFTSQARSLINFITTFSLPKMVLSSLLTCIIQYCWLWEGSSYFQISDLSCKDKDMLSMYFIVFGSAFKATPNVEKKREKGSLK